MNRQIFLVEDHPIMRSTLATLLEREPGFTICGQATTAAEALQNLETVEADLVLIDISLPDRSGLDLLADIITRWPQLRCIVLSGHDREVYAEQAEAAGAWGYIPKHEVGAIIPTIYRVLES